MGYRGVVRLALEGLQSPSILFIGLSHELLFIYYTSLSSPPGKDSPHPIISNYA